MEINNPKIIPQFKYDVFYSDRVFIFYDNGVFYISLKWFKNISKLYSQNDNNTTVDDFFKSVVMLIHSENGIKGFDVYNFTLDFKFTII